MVDPGVALCVGGGATLHSYRVLVIPSINRLLSSSTVEGLSEIRLDRVCDQNDTGENCNHYEKSEDSHDSIPPLFRIPSQSKEVNTILG